MDTNVAGDCDLLNAEFNHSEDDFSLRIPNATPLKHLILIFVKSQNYDFELEFWIKWFLKVNPTPSKFKTINKTC